MRSAGIKLLLVAMMAVFMAGPAVAQRGNDKEQLRKELIKRLDAQLKRMRRQLIRDIDRRLRRGSKSDSRSRPQARRDRNHRRGGKPFLGIALKDLRPGLRELLGIKGKGGVLVDQVAPNSSASRAGIRRTDVIVSWNRQAVNGKQQLIKLIRSAKVGDTVRLVIFRRGRKKVVELRLSARGSEGRSERSSKRPSTRPDGENRLEKFLDKALDRAKGNKRPRTRKPNSQNPDLQKMLEGMMGPDGNERMKKLMDQFRNGQGGDMQEMMKRGMEMYQDMMKNPESRKQMEEMQKRFFGGGGKGMPNQEELQKYLKRMMGGQGKDQPKATPSKRKPAKAGDRKRIQQMLDDLLGDKKGSKSPKKTTRKSTGKGFLGVGLTPLTKDLRHQLSLPVGVGVLISQVVKGSPAERSGLRQYDVIIKLGRKKIGSLTDVRAALSSRSAGSKLTAQILRGGKKRKIIITLGIRPKQEFK